MTIGDNLSDRAKQAVDGYAGKAAMAATMFIIAGLSAWVLKTTLDHSSDLTQLRDDVRSLVDVVKSHNTMVDDEIKQIAINQQTYHDQFITLEAAQKYRDELRAQHEQQRDEQREKSRPYPP